MDCELSASCPPRLELDCKVVEDWTPGFTVDCGPLVIGLPEAAGCELEAICPPEVDPTCELVDTWPLEDAASSELEVIWPPELDPNCRLLDICELKDDPNCEMVNARPRELEGSELKVICPLGVDTTYELLIDVWVLEDNRYGDVVDNWLPELAAGGELELTCPQNSTHPTDCLTPGSLKMIQIPQQAAS